MAEELDAVELPGGMMFPLSSRTYWCADNKAANLARPAGVEEGCFRGGCSPSFSHCNACFHVNHFGFGSHPASCHNFLTSDFFALFFTLWLPCPACRLAAGGFPLFPVLVVLEVVEVGLQRGSHLRLFPLQMSQNDSLSLSLSLSRSLYLYLSRSLFFSFFFFFLLAWRLGNRGRAAPPARMRHATHLPIKTNKYIYIYIYLSLSLSLSLYGGRRAGRSSPTLRALSLSLSLSLSLLLLTVVRLASLCLLDELRPAFGRPAGKDHV